MPIPIAFVAASTDDAQAALQSLRRRYDHVPPTDAGVIIVLGGDGMMLNVLSQWGPQGKRIYGLNKGTVVFLRRGVVPTDELFRGGPRNPRGLSIRCASDSVPP